VALDERCPEVAHAVEFAAPSRGLRPRTPSRAARWRSLALRRSLALTPPRPCASAVESAAR
jgi:hypothetical protein